MSKTDRLFPSLFLLFFLLPSHSVAVSPLQIEAFLENTAIARSLSNGSWQGLNRLRLDTLTTVDGYEQYSLTFLGDASLFYDSDDDYIDNNLSIYRLYGSYDGERARLVAGKQRIPFGVGKIWTPVDIFNPIDSTKIETDEREGTDSIRGEYSLNDLSIIDATLSEEKGALRLKGFLDLGDVALISQYDTEQKTAILGWELEGDLTGTGIELRSEGGFFYNRESNDTTVQAIVGCEYGFPNSLTLIGELYYDGQQNEQSFGLSASYQLNMLTVINLLTIVNLDDESFFLAPSLQYSISDEMTLDAGIFINSGESGTGYGDSPHAIFIKWFAHF
ncbi:hypothetical protein [Desulfopila sp. IMCC35008]|uniref:hypothetical protein n=1 Tax=Desulfopila sp. IMCC35008 TaxID=2653858 RepID=UPI0013CF970F|nr:hypothetical protein [Desulfopila sp. IMCC35008]